MRILLALLLFAPTTYAQEEFSIVKSDEIVITLDDNNIQPYTLFKLTANVPDVPSGTTIYFEWKFSQGVDHYVIGKGKNILATGAPGEQTANVRVTCINYDAKKYDYSVGTQSFTVGGDPPPPPQPVPNTLCDQVGSLASALTEVYRGQAEVLPTLDSITYKTFIDSHNMQLKRRGLEPTPEIILDRLAKSVEPLTDRILTKTQIESLAAELEALAKDFSECDEPNPPPGPTPAPGRRLVIIVAESANPPLSLTRIVTSLRTGGASQYLKTNSHTLYSLDPNSQLPNGTPDPMINLVKGDVNFNHLPALFILDSASRELLDSTPMPNQSGKVIDFVKKNGG